MAFPEKAYNPNISALDSLGASLAIKERLADCAGPTKMPSANPNAQKRVFESTITRQIPNIDKASNEVSIVFFGPITSSTEANKAAPGQQLGL